MTCFRGTISVEAIDQVINRLLENLSTFESQGSGWTLVAVDRLEVSTAQFNPIGGSSYIPSPEENRQHAHACLNVENKQDEFCFLYCNSSVSFEFKTIMPSAPPNIATSFHRTENRRTEIPFAVIPDPQIRTTQPRV